MIAPKVNKKKMAMNIILFALIIGAILYLVFTQIFTNVFKSGGDKKKEEVVVEEVGEEFLQLRAVDTSFLHNDPVKTMIDYGAQAIDRNRDKKINIGNERVFVQTESEKE